MQRRKQAKEKLTISFFVNAAGGMEQPIVIGKSAKPRCFKGIRDPKKPEEIPYYANPRVWMNTQVMIDILYSNREQASGEEGKENSSPTGQCELS